MTDTNAQRGYTSLVACTERREESASERKWEVGSGDAIVMGINQAALWGWKMKPGVGHKSPGM